MTEQVLKAIKEQSREIQMGKKRERECNRTRKQKKQRTQSSSGTESETSADKSESDSDSDESTSRDDSDFDDRQILSTPISSQVDSNLKNKIWQNKYIDFTK